jgi:hypothetical protein
MSRILPRRAKPQYWSPERRARQSAIAKRAWAEKPKALRSRRARLADEIDEKTYVGALGLITAEFAIRRANVILNMDKGEFTELAEAAGVEPEVIEAVRARFIRDCEEMER